MVIISEHISPLAGPSSKDPCSQTALAVTWNQELVDEQRIPVFFPAIATAPTIAISSKPGPNKGPKIVVKEKKIKHMKQKSYKREIFQENSSQSEDEEHLCDDVSNDKMNVDGKSCERK